MQPIKSGHHVLFLSDLWSSKLPGRPVKLFLLHARVFAAQHFRLFYIPIIDQFQRLKNLVVGFTMTTAPYLNSSFLLFTLVIAGTKLLGLKPFKEVRVHPGSQLGSRVCCAGRSGKQEFEVAGHLASRVRRPRGLNACFNLLIPWTVTTHI